MRNGDWIETFTGRKFYPLDPRADEVDIRDIAHSLALQCRFAGHVREFYSVAQHSILVGLLVPKPDRLWGLFHDASEAYLVDLPRPIKHDALFGERFRQAEYRLMLVISNAFNLPWPEPESVRLADWRACVNEGRLLMYGKTENWESAPANVEALPPELAIFPEEPVVAEQKFLRYFERWRCYGDKV